jgi:hypothetical protein
MANRCIGYSHVVACNTLNITVTITQRNVFNVCLLGNTMNLEEFVVSRIVELSLMLSESICLEIKNASGDYDQIFFTVKTVAGLVIWGALSNERTGLSFTIAAGPRQRSHFRIRVPYDSRPYFTVPDSRLPFHRLLRLAGLRWKYSVLSGKLVVFY